MQEFIQSITQQLGIGEDTAKSATSGVLGFLKDKVGGDTFSSLLSKIPGADQFVGDGGGESSDSGGGLLGGITSMASSAIGGDAGEGIELTSLLQNAGLDAEQGTSFLGKLVGFIKEKAGDDIVQQIAEKIPALKSVLA
jgi:hypothetical protein